MQAAVFLNTVMDDIGLSLNLLKMFIQGCWAKVARCKLPKSIKHFFQSLHALAAQWFEFAYNFRIVKLI